MKKILVLMNFFLLILLFGFSVWKEENNLKKESFYLKTAPRDPRSIMQGDYMALNYELGDNISKNLNLSEGKKNRKGYVKVKLDEKKIAHFESLEKNYSELTGDEKILCFLKDGFLIDLGINSYFFQEGKGLEFQNAEYAEVIHLKGGKLRLKSLRDKNFQKLK